MWDSRNVGTLPLPTTIQWELKTESCGAGRQFQGKDAQRGVVLG
jgi:hypothetical protein